MIPWILELATFLKGHFLQDNPAIMEPLEKVMSKPKFYGPHPDQKAPKHNTKKICEQTKDVTFSSHSPPQVPTSKPI
jgi:hypothetical protein